MAIGRKKSIYFNALKTKSGAQTRIRTTDTRIFSPLLYQLSYLGMLHKKYKALAVITLKFSLSSHQKKNN